jgi:glycosyltransferase involved in cell wall biosynthesis
MKIALLDNDIRTADMSGTTGVQTYGRHLLDGIKQLGYEADIVGFTKTGRRTKSIQNSPEYTIYKFEQRDEILDQYDAIIVLIGTFQPADDEYEWLSKFKDKKYVVIEHSHDQSYRKHGYAQLFETIGLKPMVCSSLIAQKTYKEKYDIDATIVRLPFSKNLVPEPVEKIESDKFRVTFPHRFIPFKRADIAIKFMQEEIGDNIDWVMNLFGMANSNSIYWSDLRFQTDPTQDRYSTEPFLDKRITLHRPYLHEALPGIYAETDLTLETTKTKGDGGRLQYTLLESIHNSIPVSIHECWLEGLGEENIDPCLVAHETYVPMDLDSFLRYRTDSEYKTNLIEKGHAMIDEYFDAKVAAQTFINLLNDQ